MPFLTPFLLYDDEAVPQVPRPSSCSCPVVARAQNRKFVHKTGLFRCMSQRVSFAGGGGCYRSASLYFSTPVTASSPKQSPSHNAR